MDCIIGIDGGGTKTMLRLVDRERNALCELFGDAINRYALPADTVRENLTALLDKALSSIPGANVLAICLGTAGAINEQDYNFYKDILYAYSSRVSIYDDVYTMLVANLKKHPAPGIVFTCGTGSIFYGRDKDGVVARVGGWGHIMSDEGSGYEIGVAALRVAAKNYDLQKDMSSMTDLLIKSFSCNDFFELVDHVHTQSSSKKNIAHLAKLVDTAAHMGDKDAIDILSRSAVHLCEMCEILINRLSLDSAPFYIYVNGSVIQKSAFVRDVFDDEIKSRYPMCTVENVSIDSAWGAIEIAFELIKNHN